MDLSSLVPAVDKRPRLATPFPPWAPMRTASGAAPIAPVQPVALARHYWGRTGTRLHSSTLESSWLERAGKQQGLPLPGVPESSVKSPFPWKWRGRCLEAARRAEGLLLVLGHLQASCRQLRLLHATLHPLSQSACGPPKGSFLGMFLPVGFKFTGGRF